MHEEIVKAEMATAIEDKHQIKVVEEGGIRCITPIKVKEEPSTQYAVIDLTDKKGLPDIPAEIFNCPLKIEYDSYSESDVTDEPDYIPDDEPLKETDEEDLAKMEDKNISSIDVNHIETTLKQISNGLQQAAEGYNSLQKMSSHNDIGGNNWSGTTNSHAISTTNALRNSKSCRN